MGENRNNRKSLTFFFFFFNVRILLIPAGYNIIGLWSYEMVKMTLAEVERSQRDLTGNSEYVKLGKKLISGLLRYFVICETTIFMELSFAIYCCLGPLSPCWTLI